MLPDAELGGPVGSANVQAAPGGCVAAWRNFDSFRDWRDRRRGAGRALSLLGVLVATLAGCSAADPDLGGLRADEIDYNWHVRPILSENCFKCHGPDAEAREAGLRLDLGELAVQELPETPGKYAIVPGSSESSELVRRILATDVDVRMPPESTHKTLTPKQIAILRHWIDNGAEYRPHWAFSTPERPPVPTTALDARAVNEVDRFVLRRLEREDLVPAGEADKETLINRVSLTLTGLPPTLEEVDAFVGDPAPDAYERLVDRLLASPAYAEHMAEYWLDLARFSESDGFLDDHHDRVLWPWRDWVIQAFRDNVPFDRFGTEQLAGDLLPQAETTAMDGGSAANAGAVSRPQQVLATAFLRVGKRTTENGAIDAEYKAEYMVERTDNALGTAFLGLTVGCARCHDHKYDPIMQRDYYSLGAFFNSNDEPGAYAPGFSGIQGGPTLPWPDDETAARLRDASAAVAQRAGEYRTALSLAADSADAGASRLAAEGRERIAAAVRSSLDDSLAAYYAFDSARPAALTDLPAPRPPRIPPKTVTEFQRNPFSGPPAPPATTPEERRARERVALCDARPSQLQRRGARVVRRRDARHRAGGDPRPEIPRRRTRPGALVRRDESRVLGPRRGLVRPHGFFQCRLLVLRRRRLRERAGAQSPRGAELRPHRVPFHDRGRQALGFARAFAACQHDSDRDDCGAAGRRVDAHRIHVRRLEPCGRHASLLERRAGRRRGRSTTISRAASCPGRLPTCSIRFSA